MRRKNDDPIEIALCFDSNYEFYAAVSIYSVLISSRYPVRFWLVTPPDFVKTLGVFDDLSARFAVDINFIKISSNPFAVWKTGAHFSSANYLRLLLPDVLAIDKVIYIDSDILVIDCLNELWQLDLGDRSIGAVVDPWWRDISLPLKRPNEYINSGVLLLNLDKMRARSFFEQCRTTYAQRNAEISLVDQCLINLVLEHDKVLLPSEWNYQFRVWETTKAKFRKILELNPKILHFVGGLKAWHAWASPPVFEYYARTARNVSRDYMRYLHEPKTISQHLNYARSLMASQDSQSAAEHLLMVADQLAKKLVEKS